MVVRRDRWQGWESVWTQNSWTRSDLLGLFTSLPRECKLHEGRACGCFVYYCILGTQNMAWAGAGPRKELLKE